MLPRLYETGGDGVAAFSVVLAETFAWNDCWQGHESWPEEPLSETGRDHRHVRIGETLVGLPPFRGHKRRGDPTERYLVLRKLGFGYYASVWLCRPVYTHLSPWSNQYVRRIYRQVANGNATDINMQP